MSTRIKICGITRVEDALEAVRVGASAIGMIFTASQRRVDPAVAREVCLALPPYVDRVGVFLDEPAAELQRVLRDVPLTRVQLHGRETPAVARDLPGALTRALIFDGTDLRVQMQPWLEARPDAQFLVDLPKGNATPARESLWRAAATLARECPLTLAGGLDPRNVVRALERVRPAAVDVARGVEKSPGIKDPLALREFCRAVFQVDATRSDRP